MKFSTTMIVAALAAVVAVVPASATSEESFGPVSNVMDVAGVESSLNQAHRALEVKPCNEFTITSCPKRCKNCKGKCVAQSNPCKPQIPPSD